MAEWLVRRTPQPQDRGFETRQNQLAHKQEPRGLDALLGHLLVKRTPVTFQFSSTKIPEYLSQK